MKDNILIGSPYRSGAPSMIRARIEAAQSGDFEAARLLVGHYADWRRRGKALPKELEAYVLECLDLIGSGVDADVALKLKRPLGHPRAAGVEKLDKLELAQQVDDLRSDGLSYQDAVTEVASRSAPSEPTVERAYGKFGTRRTTRSYLAKIKKGLKDRR